MGNDLYLDVKKVKEDLKRWNQILRDMSDKLLDLNMMMTKLNKDFQELWEAIEQDAKD